METGSAHAWGRDSDARVAAQVLGHRHLVLVGLMGAGKSAIGRRLAEALARPFADSDTVIEEEAGQTIADMFARDGEEAFRRVEEAVLGRLLEGAPAVIATGGGAFLRPTNRARIREAALSVWLRADLDVLVGRIRRPATRPLLAGDDLRDTLTSLMRKRYPVYAAADVVVDSEDVDRAVTVRRALAAVAALGA
ncbi:MAG: shikimate kinase [Alphaproteobacteria bacterium]|nr:shikimate kinase [Alphaproteobacteria bacterium]